MGAEVPQRAIRAGQLDGLVIHLIRSPGRPSGLNGKAVDERILLRDTNRWPRITRCGC